MPYGGAKIVVTSCNRCMVAHILPPSPTMRQVSLAHPVIKQRLVICPMGGKVLTTYPVVGQGLPTCTLMGKIRPTSPMVGKSLPRCLAIGEKLPTCAMVGPNLAPCDVVGVESAHMHYGGGKRSRMPCVVAQSTSMLRGTAKAPHALCTMHYGGVKFHYLPCGGRNIQVHAQMGVGCIVQPRAQWWGKDCYHASLRVMPCPGGKSCQMPYSWVKSAHILSVVAQNPPTRIVVGQG